MSLDKAEQQSQDDNQSFLDAVADQKSDARPIAEISSQSAEHIMQFFTYEHLPTHLQVVSALFYNLATEIVGRCPRNPERTVALRKLLESKDAAVRASIACNE